MAIRKTRASIGSLQISRQRTDCTALGPLCGLERGAVDMSARATTTATMSMSGMNRIRIPLRLILIV
jgi:hypothetical protein